MPVGLVGIWSLVHGTGLEQLRMEQRDCLDRAMHHFSFRPKVGLLDRDVEASDRTESRTGARDRRRKGATCVNVRLRMLSRQLLKKMASV